MSRASSAFVDFACAFVIFVVVLFNAVQHARAQSAKCTPAVSNAVIYDNATKQVTMIVKPDCEEQLDDPAFNPPGHTQVRLAKPVYNAGVKSAIEQLVPDVKLHLEPVPPPPPEPCKENCEEPPPLEEMIEVTP